MQKTSTTFPMTRQGVRDLDNAPGNFLPVSGGLVSQQPGAINVGAGERMLSAVGGGVLTAIGLGRGDALGLGAALVGLALVFRGMTGHCDVYVALGKDTSGTDPSAEIAYRAG